MLYTNIFFLLEKEQCTSLSSNSQNFEV